MKKVILTLALVAFAFGANAQWVVGGQFGFNTTGGSTNVEATTLTHAYSYPATQSLNFQLNPTVSYVLNDNMQVGLSLGYNYGSTTNHTPAAYYNDNEAWTKNTASSFSIAPFFRYYFATVNKFSFFCEAKLGIDITPRSTTHTYSTFGVNVDNETSGAWSSSAIALTFVPGVNYRINDNWSADCYIDLAGLYFTHNSTKNFAGDDLVDTQNVNNFGLMADASAQTLNAHFGNIRIGFNYHF